MKEILRVGEEYKIIVFNKPKMKRELSDKSKWEMVNGIVYTGACKTLSAICYLKVRGIIEMKFQIFVIFPFQLAIYDYHCDIWYYIYVNL